MSNYLDISLNEKSWLKEEYNTKVIMKNVYEDLAEINWQRVTEEMNEMKNE